ncbi:MAG: S8 family peptidase [Gemmatimonadetes bacterium]|nr:S8 family peptidase [Gemmatimonadota bacterium]
MSDALPPAGKPRPIGSGPPLPGGNPRQAGFTPEVLDRTVIAIPLLHEIRREMSRRERHLAAGWPRPRGRLYPVVIDLNLDYFGGRGGAREQIATMIRDAATAHGEFRPREDQGIAWQKSRYSQQYLFACLEADVIQEIVRREKGETSERRAIYRVWPDFPVRALVTRSLSTVKADAARVSFSAMGEGVVWAVLDSGIEGNHPHFALHRNLDLPDPLEHHDFTIERLSIAPPQPSGVPAAAGSAFSAASALSDDFGHGTHVAGILAGEWTPDGVRKATEKLAAHDAFLSGEAGSSAAAQLDPAQRDAFTILAKSRARAITRQRDELGNVTYRDAELPAVSGMAPRCKLVSFKVLNARGRGRASNLIAALEHIQEINGHGRRLLIHGVNMSVGYDFEPEWFACGQSPLCVEVDRMVRSGVSVVVAAGNTGYGQQATSFRGTVSSGLPLSINDPGNAELAVTVGATHREMPHMYGVSYFSSKGPTGDGRPKPDLVAPGEKIISCAAGARLDAIRAQAGDCEYLEESGTSMAAPHVSGVIAAFLSVRREFIGRPEDVKEIFLSTATDLKRDRYFQGHGLVDLMRAIQSV